MMPSACECDSHPLSALHIISFLCWLSTLVIMNLNRVCVCLCVCTRRRLYLCLYLFILHSLQRHGGQCTEMKQKILFGKRGQSTHLKKHIIGKCSSTYQVGRRVITCTVLIVKLLANVAAVLWMMTMSSWIMLALLTVSLFVFSPLQYKNF